MTTARRILCRYPRYTGRERFQFWQGRLLHWLARRLPRALRSWVIVDAWTHATTGRWSHTDVTRITVVTMLDRFDQ